MKTIVFLTLGVKAWAGYFKRLNTLQQYEARECIESDSYGGVLFVGFFFFSSHQALEKDLIWFSFFVCLIVTTADV